MAPTSSSSELPQTGLDRRRLLAGAGAGAAAVVGLTTATTGPAAAATPITSPRGSAAISGYVYRTVSFFDFTPQGHTSNRAWGDFGTYTYPSADYLWASVDVPAGARVRDVEWYAYNQTGLSFSAMARMWVAGYGVLDERLVDVSITSDFKTQAYRGTVPTSAYGPYPLGCKVMLGIGTPSNGNLQINGARVGFSHGGGATGLLSTPVRAYDSRQVGGLLSAGTTRTITLPTSVCPVGTTALVVNLIAVSAEKTGFLRMWPGHVADTDTSAINFVKGTTIANAQTVGVSASRQLKLRSSAKMHVVIDVLGTIG